MWQLLGVMLLLAPGVELRPQTVDLSLGPVSVGTLPDAPVHAHTLDDEPAPAHTTLGPDTSSEEDSDEKVHKPVKLDPSPQHGSPHASRRNAPEHVPKPPHNTNSTGPKDESEEEGSVKHRRQTAPVQPSDQQTPQDQPAGDYYYDDYYNDGSEQAEETPANGQDAQKNTPLQFVPAVGQRRRRETEVKAEPEVKKTDTEPKPVESHEAKEKQHDEEKKNVAEEEVKAHSKRQAEGPDALDYPNYDNAQNDYYDDAVVPSDEIPDFTKIENVSPFELTKRSDGTHRGGLPETEAQKIAHESPIEPIKPEKTEEGGDDEREDATTTLKPKPKQKRETQEPPTTATPPKENKNTGAANLEAKPQIEPAKKPEHHDSKRKHSGHKDSQEENDDSEESHHGAEHSRQKRDVLKPGSSDSKDESKTDNDRPKQVAIDTLVSVPVALPKPSVPAAPKNTPPIVKREANHEEEVEEKEHKKEEHKEHEPAHDEKEEHQEDAKKEHHNEEHEISDGHIRLAREDHEGAVDTKKSSTHDHDDDEKEPHPTTTASPHDPKPKSTNHDEERHKRDIHLGNKPYVLQRDPDEAPAAGKFRRTRKTSDKPDVELKPTAIHQPVITTKPKDPKPAVAKPKESIDEQVRTKRQANSPAKPAPAVPVPANVNPKPAAVPGSVNPKPAAAPASVNPRPAPVPANVNPKPAPNAVPNAPAAKPIGASRPAAPPTNAKPASVPSGTQAPRKPQTPGARPARPARPNSPQNRPAGTRQPGSQATRRSQTSTTKPPVPPRPSTQQPPKPVSQIPTSKPATRPASPSPPPANGRPVSPVPTSTPAVRPVSRNPPPVTGKPVSQIPNSTPATKPVSPNPPPVSGQQTPNQRTKREAPEETHHKEEAGKKEEPKETHGEQHDEKEQAEDAKEHHEGHEQPEHHEKTKRSDVIDKVLPAEPKAPAPVAPVVSPSVAPSPVAPAVASKPVEAQPVPAHEPVSHAEQPRLLPLAQQPVAQPVVESKSARMLEHQADAPASKHTPGHWSYNNEEALEDWGRMFPVCGGPRQSPININTSDVSFTTFEPWNFENYDQIPEKTVLKNNGHSAQLEITLNKVPTVSGGGLPHKYKFAQLHFHWGSRSVHGSEHTVNGRRFPLEIHLVHYSEQYPNISAAVASGAGDALAVFGFFYEISASDNPTLAPVTDALKLVDSPSSVVTITEPKPLQTFFARNLSPYFRYEGSLTTPPCNEIVIWTVFEEKVRISEKQLQAFRRMKTEEGDSMVDNFRPVQNDADPHGHLPPHAGEHRIVYYNSPKDVYAFDVAPELGKSAKSTKADGPEHKSAKSDGSSIQAASMAAALPLVFFMAHRRG